MATKVLIISHYGYIFINIFYDIKKQYISQTFLVQYLPIIFKKVVSLQP